MILEVLFSNVANLYGDLYNVNLLKETLEDDLTIHYTEFYQEPYFVNNKVDMIYIGSMMEKYQSIAIDSLMPYKRKINELIENGTLILSTGNSFEIFGQNISYLKGLGLFDYSSEIDYSHHHNSCYLGKFDGNYITGFKSCFSYTSGNDLPLFETVKGYGFKDDKSNEGVRKNNFFGTYLIGPVLVLNPDFTHYLLRLLNADRPLKNEKAIREAYDYRVKEYLTYEDFKEFKH